MPKGAIINREIYLAHAKEEVQRSNQVPRSETVEQSTTLLKDAESEFFYVDDDRDRRGDQVMNQLRKGLVDAMMKL